MAPPKSPPRKPAAKKPLFTSAARRQKIRETLGNVAGVIESRGGEVNVATGFILKSNADLLAESYGQVADEYDWFARWVDQILTGGVWGQFIAVHLAVGVQIGLVRGWIEPEQLPEPLRMFFAPFTPPPPSEEVQEEARRKAEGNGKPKTPPKTPPRRAPKKAPKDSEK